MTGGAPPRLRRFLSFGGPSIDRFHQEYVSPCGEVRLRYDSPNTREARAEIAWMINETAERHERSCSRCQAILAERQTKQQGRQLEFGL